MTARLRALLRKPPEFVLLLLYIATVPVMSFFHLRLGGQALLLCDFIFVLVVLASLRRYSGEPCDPASLKHSWCSTWQATLVQRWFPGPAIWEWSK